MPSDAPPLPFPGFSLAGQAFAPSARHGRQTLPLAALLGRLGLGEQPRTFAIWPVWTNSTRKQVKFQPLPKRQAVRLWHDARRFERQTREPGFQDGALGRNGLAVLHALLFDFLNYATGKLYPARQAIAHRANVSLRSVDRGLAKLKTSGVVNWLRRCVEEWIDDRFSLRQESNAYAVLPPSQWRGYRAPQDAPPPDAGTWGDHPPLPDALTLAKQAAEEGGGLTAQLTALESDDRNGLAAALARWGRSLERRRDG